MIENADAREKICHNAPSVLLDRGTYPRDPKKQSELLKNRLFFKKSK